MTKRKSYFHYWGKSDEDAWHCLPFHCLDVGAVGLQLLNQHPPVLKHFTQLTGFAADDFVRWSTFMLTRHKASGQRARIDLVMDQKIQSGWQGQPAHKRAPLQQLVQQAGEQWLEKRQERLGIMLDALTADGYRQHRSFKRGVSTPMLYSSCDLEGAITVIDPDALRTALYHGVGAAKALGCGLLLIKPM